MLYSVYFFSLLGFFFTAHAVSVSSMSVFSVTVRKCFICVVRRLDALMLLTKPWAMDQHLIGYGDWGWVCRTKRSKGGRSIAAGHLWSGAPRLPQWPLRAALQWQQLPGQLTCSRTCRGISSKLWIGGESRQVKNIYVFGWTLHGLMCQVENPAHWQGFPQRRPTECVSEGRSWSTADTWALSSHGEGQHVLRLSWLLPLWLLGGPRSLMGQAGDLV